MNSNLSIHPIVGRGEMEMLRAVGISDGHANLVLPTHVAIRNDRIVGSCSIGSIPLLQTWLHSKLLRPAESLRLIKMFEHEAAGKWPVICVPCAVKSPFFEHMTKHLGYTDLGDLRLFAKALHPPVGTHSTASLDRPGNVRDRVESVPT